MAVGSGVTGRGIHYLLATERPDLSGITQQIANDVDGLFGGIATTLADTGWLDITVNNGYVGGSGLDKPQVRVRFGIVTFKGTISPNSGSFGANGTPAIASVPSQAWPTNTNDSLKLIAGNTTPTSVRAAIDAANGNLGLFIGPSAPSGVFLAGLSGYLAAGV